MAQLLVLYKTPKDAAAFDKHYRETHVPLAKKLAGLRKYETSRGVVASPAGPSGVHLVATLHFDSLQAIQQAFASPEGQAAAADAQALGSHDLFFFDNEQV